MSDWKSRAVKVESDSDWKARAKPVEPPVESPPVAQPVPESPPLVDGNALLRGFGQGASFGFTDELSGAIMGTVANRVDDAARMMGMNDAQRDELRYRLTGAQPRETGGAGVDGSAYQAARDEMRRGNAAAQKDSPWQYGGAQLAGGIATPAPALKGLNTLGRAAVGGGLGALSSTGLSEKDTKGGVARDAVDGANVGALVTPAIGAVTDKLGGGFARWLKSRAEDSALKSIGLRAGISDQLGKRGYTADKGRGLGRAALDMELIRPFRTVEDVAERAGFAKEVQGARIEQALADADAVGVPFDTERAAWQSAGEVMGPDGLSPTAIREATRARKLVDDIVRLPNVQEPTFANANAMKSDMYAGINYGTDPALKTTIERRAASGLRQSIEDQVAERAGPDVADELRAANRAYGLLADIQPLAQEEANRQLARKNMTMLDWASVIGGGASLGAATNPGAGLVGAAGILGTKLLGPRIPSTMAVGMDSASRALPKAANALEPVVVKSLTGAQGQIAVKNAYQSLLERFGISPKSKQELADEAFLKGQVDPSLQVGR